MDVRYIQSLSGHNDPKTTTIYTNISRQKISTFDNQPDNLDLNNQKITNVISAPYKYVNPPEFWGDISPFTTNGVVL